MIDTDHWRHFFLLLGMIWGLAAATYRHLRRQPAALPQGRMVQEVVHEAWRMSLEALTPTAPAPAQRSALRRLWQRLPQQSRRQILFDVSRVIAPTARCRRRAADFRSVSPGCFQPRADSAKAPALPTRRLMAAGFAPSAFDLSAAFGQVGIFVADIPPHAWPRQRQPDRASQRSIHATRALGARPGASP